MNIAINSFVKRQTSESPYSHYAGTEEQLLRAIEINFDRAKPGYRDGVILVSVPPYGFYTGLVTLESGDELTGSYSSRVPGEEPRKHLFVKRVTGKMPAKAVDIVLYRHDVLAENNEADTDADWEVVSINARPSLEEQPIEPMTLIYNHFELSGGTKTNLSSEEFVIKLKESVLYWKDKSFIG